ncbi:hypothetical protein MRX96_054654 [Rhipicephalus microplus]
MKDTLETHLSSLFTGLLQKTKTCQLWQPWQNSQKLPSEKYWLSSDSTMFWLQPLSAASSKQDLEAERKLLMRAENKAKRLQFSEDHAHWSASHWKRMTLTIRSTFRTRWD